MIFRCGIYNRSSHGRENSLAGERSLGRKLCASFAGRGERGKRYIQSREMPEMSRSSDFLRTMPNNDYLLNFHKLSRNSIHYHCYQIFRRASTKSIGIIIHI